MGEMARWQDGKMAPHPLSPSPKAFGEGDRG